MKKKWIHIGDAPRVNVQNQDAVLCRLEKPAITQFRSAKRLLSLRLVAVQGFDLMIGIHNPNFPMNFDLQNSLGEQAVTLGGKHMRCHGVNTP